MTALEFVADRKTKTPAGKKYMTAVCEGGLCSRRAGARVRPQPDDVAAAHPRPQGRAAIVDAVTYAVEREARPGAMTSLKKGLLLDFGGVISVTLFERHRLTEKLLGLPAGTMKWRAHSIRRPTTCGAT